MSKTVTELVLKFLSLRVAVPTPGGKTEGRERRSLPLVFPRGVGTATRRLEIVPGRRAAIFKSEVTGCLSPVNQDLADVF